MAGVVVSVLVMVALVVCAGTADIVAAEPAAAARGQYQVVKVCWPFIVAEVKKLAPWEPMFDQMKVEEEAFSGRLLLQLPDSHRAGDAVPADDD